MLTSQLNPEVANISVANMLKLARWLILEIQDAAPQFWYGRASPIMLTSLLKVATLQDVSMAHMLQPATRCSLAQPYHPLIIQGRKRGGGSTTLSTHLIFVLTQDLSVVQLSS